MQLFVFSQEVVFQVKPALVVLRLVKDVFVLRRNRHFLLLVGDRAWRGGLDTEHGLTGLTRHVSMLGHVCGSQPLLGSALDAVEHPAARPGTEGGGGGADLVDEQTVSTCSVSLRLVLVRSVRMSVRLAAIVNSHVLKCLLVSSQRCPDENISSVKAPVNWSHKSYRERQSLLCFVSRHCGLIIN